MSYTLLIATLSLSSKILSANAAAPYCVPGQNCFPSSAILSEFNASISGRLHSPAPYASVCYNPTYDAAACEEVFANKGVGEYRIELPSALMYTNWELDDSGNGCPAPSVKPTGPLNGTCTLGALAKYEVFAQSAQDVAASVKFAAKYNLRLRIKNTGHDYVGRSSAQGSFTIWTHQLKETSFSSTFKPDGCHVSAQPAVLAGPALTVRDIYEAADKFKVQLVAGFTGTVGAGGGWTVGGGLGPFSRFYGMGVDNVLQFQVVTADGEIKIANECTNTDLFWALRGGGGAFGVTTQIVFKAHPVLKGVNVVVGALTANSSQTFTTLIREWIRLHPEFDQAGFGGISESSSLTLAVIMVHPFIDAAPVSANETFSHFSSIVSIPGVASTLKSTSSPTWLEVYNQVVVPALAPGGLVGVSLLLGDSIASKDVFATAESREPLVQFAAQAASPVIYQFVAGGAVSTANDSATSVHPAWRNALIHLNLPIFGTAEGVTAEQQDAVKKIAAAADAALYPDGAAPAAYYNEDFADEPNPQQRWWGSKYARLLELKKKLDPQGVFSCRQCVGSEVNGF